ncbi:hypothetical protein EDC59_110135 [Pseudodesulfovibrio indicus]|uniref:Mpv17 / PMP22 family protein n=2 Tax=Desulfovibrionaceae TaxID=194924 RepID=A0AA94PLW0_9BACT|nr:hypothetical protein EDC59_110135 [Pseudodesulfovibrio indicus]
MPNVLFFNPTIQEDILKYLDVVFAALFCALCALATFPVTAQAFKAWTLANPLLSSFIKFALLGTFGECLALRLYTGRYCVPGLAPKMLMWGVNGVIIAMAFAVFTNGTGNLMQLLGIPGSSAPASLFERCLWAFSVSVTFNLVFSPVFMLFHKLTDTHIVHTGGRLGRFLSTPPAPARYFSEINWDIMWGFTFKKAIPFFLIPANTITFMLPPHLRILSAGIIGIGLGLILAAALHKAKLRNAVTA